MALALGNNSNNNYADHGDLAAMNGATALTLAFWAAGGAAVGAGDISKGTVHYFQMGGTREYQLKEDAIWTLISAENTVHADILNWNHYALVYDGSLAVTNRITLYMNALSLPLTGIDTSKPQGSNAATTAPTSLPDTSPNALQCGNSNVSGLTGHLRLWAAALTGAEVAAEMHRYWAARRTHLLLDAPYDDALFARDYSGNGNHGTWDPINGTPEQRQGPPVSYGGKVLVTG